ncbi:MAG: hypothetical protein M1830_002520 [Pleopsidium flavum]|nr:MAG: hypothetical protein M1830_002520 [Pleopsidium flavum]
MAEDRHADPATQLTVDEMILDYLLFMAAKALLEDRKAQRTGTQVPPSVVCHADLALSMVDAFLTVFRANHPSHRASLNMQSRLRLLRYTTLFTRRISSWPSSPLLPSLENLRSQNGERASTWLSHRGPLPTFADSRLQVFTTALPLPEATLSRNRQHVSTVLMAPTGLTLFYGLQKCLSLLDTLPGFMALSAAQIAMHSSRSVTRIWMSLAAQYMTQSALEQYLVYGEQGSEALLEAFAWGFDADLVAEEGTEEWETNAMFWDGDEELKGWEDIRGMHLRAIKFAPEPEIALETHLEDLAMSNPIEEFENDMMAFLEASLGCQPSPTLAQLEAGELEGLSRPETDRLRERVGFEC